MKLNREFYLDRVRACWMGKNIGGTMGAPFERTQKILDISGFTSPKGEPIPNDDLDLQLIWLTAVEDFGIRNTTPKLLGNYWLDFVTGPWNEYGIAKANMKSGIAPPYSGEYKNDLWKHSNGAWIRTEIWACLFPGFPSLAAQYAYHDACVDHGMGEGTYAAMYVAALESAAFFENDVRKLIEQSLSYIPENCKTAQAIKLVCDMYDKKADWKDTRNALVKLCEDIGWFMAPANVGFVILGLLYGEGDYKKSMIYAINCGDDTDCTGATIGSIMGLVNGMSYVPEDWTEYIGDSIISVAIDQSYSRRCKSITELVERVYRLVPSTLMAYGIYMEYTDGETEREEYFRTPYREALPIPEKGIAVYFPDMVHAVVFAELDKAEISAGESVKIKFKVQNRRNDYKHMIVRLNLPEGWTADKNEASVFVQQWASGDNFKLGETEITVTAGENVNFVNKIYAEVSFAERPFEEIQVIRVFGKTDCKNFY